MALAEDDKKRPQKPGPEPDRLKIEGDWKEALRGAVRGEASDDEDDESERHGDDDEADGADAGPARR